LGAALFAAPPQRVVSQTVGTDELLLALADPSQIAALSHLSKDPIFSPVAREAASHACLRTSDAESILKFHPDLVLIASYTRAETKALLRKTGVKLLVLERFESLDDLYANARAIGSALGHPDRAEAAILGWQRRVTGLKEKLQGVRPVRVLPASTFPFTSGAGTTFQDVCEHAGALNVAAEAGLRGHQPTPTEKLLTWNVEVLVASGEEGLRVIERLRELPSYKFLPAMRAGRVVLVSGPRMASTAHARLDAYEELARALHPERFK
jgi:iron complex transport system substrate-binding protein